MHAIADVPSRSALSFLGLLLRPRDFRRCWLVPSVAAKTTSRCGNKHWSPSLHEPSRFQNIHVGLCLYSHLSPFVHVPFACILQACCPFPLPASGWPDWAAAVCLLCSALVSLPVTGSRPETSGRWSLSHFGQFGQTPFFLKPWQNQYFCFRNMSGCSWLLLAASACFWFLLAAPG